MGQRASERVAASCAAGRGSAIGARRRHTTASPITSGTTIGHIWRHNRRSIISMRPRRKCFDLGPKEASIAFGRRTFARATCARVISVVLVCRLCRASRLTRPRPALRRAPAQRPPPPVGCRASPSQAALGRAHTNGQTGEQANAHKRTGAQARDCPAGDPIGARAQDLLPSVAAKCCPSRDEWSYLSQAA